MGEFELIERLQRVVPTQGDGVALSIGDDAAILQLSDSDDLVVSTDTLNLDTHFTAETAPADLAHKALAVSLSDLAAMGAVPHYALLNLSLPEAEPEWLDAFARGWAGLARSADVALVGGDTCRGPLSVSVTALGSVARGKRLTRGGAEPGEWLGVTGVLGDAALALRERRAGKTPPDGPAKALDRPSPRLQFGAALIDRATACIDISDGLLADLGHLCRSSGTGARLELARLPGSNAIKRLSDSDRWPLQLSGGEDYELCFTAPAKVWAEIESSAANAGHAVTFLGEVTAEPSLVCVQADGEVMTPIEPGFDHFARRPGRLQS